MLDAAGRHRGQRRARRRRGRGRPDARRGAPGRPRRPRARHRHLPGDPRPRRRGGRRGRARNVGTRELDGERLDVDARRVRRRDLPARADLPARPAAALAGQYRALRPGGRIAAIVYSHADRNALLRDPGVGDPATRPAPAARARPAGAFSLGAPRRRWRTRCAGPGSATSARARSSPRCACRRRGECVRFERESFGALHQMLAGLDPAEREAAWQEIADELARFDSRRGLRGAVRAGRRLGHEVAVICSRPGCGRAARRARPRPPPGRGRRGGPGAPRRSRAAGPAGPPRTGPSGATPPGRTAAPRPAAR